MAGHYFDEYRRLSLLLSKGIHINAVLDSIGITRIYLYGIGELGRIILDDTKESGVVISAFDKSVKNPELLQLEGMATISVANPQSIPDDDVPILISPSAKTKEIISELLASGIDRRRLITFNVLLYIGWLIYIKGYSQAYNFMNRNFLIVGANFDNKGSQAMTFVAMHEIKKKTPNCNIWFCPNFWDDVYDKECYKLLVLRDGYDEESTIFEVLSSIDAIIDVSGYAIASINGFGATSRSTYFMKLAYDRDIPYYMMPQSFGPFDFPGYQLVELKELLSSVRVIYAREKKGEKLLKELELSNVKRSLDMVLLSDEVGEGEVYYKKTGKRDDTYGLEGVALIPNQNLCLFFEAQAVVEYYARIVLYLRSIGKKVHIIPHSNDNVLCESIFEKCGKDQVDLHTGLLDCFEFSRMITKLDYLVASRYHSLVHAYKNAIPCVAVGWADKYNELLDEFSQNEYLVDIRKGLDIDKTIDIINKMEARNKKECLLIKKKIATLKAADYFDSFENFK